MPNGVEINYSNMCDPQKGLVPYLATSVKRLIVTEDTAALQEIINDMAQLANDIWDLIDQIDQARQDYEGMMNKRRELENALEEQKRMLEELEAETNEKFGDLLDDSSDIDSFPIEDFVDTGRQPESSGGFIFGSDIDTLAVEDERVKREERQNAATGFDFGLPSDKPSERTPDPYIPISDIQNILSGSVSGEDEPALPGAAPKALGAEAEPFRQAPQQPNMMNPNMMPPNMAEAYPNGYPMYPNGYPMYPNMMPNMGQGDQPAQQYPMMYPNMMPPNMAEAYPNGMMSGQEGGQPNGYPMYPFGYTSQPVSQQIPPEQPDSDFAADDVAEEDPLDTVEPAETADFDFEFGEFEIGEHEPVVSDDDFDAFETETVDFELDDEVASSLPTSIFDDFAPAEPLADIEDVYEDADDGYTSPFDSEDGFEEELEDDPLFDDVYEDVYGAAVPEDSVFAEPEPELEPDKQEEPEEDEYEDADDFEDDDFFMD